MSAISVRAGVHDGGHVAGEHALVPCPTCGSAAKRCKRPSGHEAAEWHMDREDALALLRRGTCPRCAEWTRQRDLDRRVAGGSR